MIHSSYSKAEIAKLLGIGLIAFLIVGFGKIEKGIPISKALNFPADRKLTIVCVGAHPGDPEFGCGGTMAKFSESGHRVIFLYLTRGEAYDPKKTFEESAAIRTKEAEMACGILHAEPKYVGQIDGHTILNNEKTEEMGKLLTSIRPDIVFTQWPVDTHPDHQTASLLVLNSWEKTGKPFELYFYEVNTGSETLSFVPTDYIDISSWRERKKSALMAHKSQDHDGTYLKWLKNMKQFLRL
jgi:LmbE family N-acetylglucosaminyl deacetylase